MFINVKEDIKISNDLDLERGTQGILRGLQFLFYGNQLDLSVQIERDLFDLDRGYLNVSEEWSNQVVHQYIGMDRGTLYFPKGEYYLGGSVIDNNIVNNFNSDTGDASYSYEILYQNRYAPDGERSPAQENRFKHHVSYLKIPKGIKLLFDPGAILYLGYTSKAQRERHIARQLYPTIGQFLILDIQGEVEAGPHQIFDVWQMSKAVRLTAGEESISIFDWAAMSGMVIGPRQIRGES